MRALITVLPILIAAPGVADVTHSFNTRFGVSYVEGPGQPQGQTRGLYSGEYYMTITHGTDSGYRFQFDLGVGVGNLDQGRPLYDPPTGAGHWFTTD